jgi:hypothetical protein
MRTLLLASLTISALQNPADACGPYVVEPTVYGLVNGYAVLNQAPTGDTALTWRRLVPNSYDNTQIADTTRFATPITITLVGPAGNKVVSSRERAVIKWGWGPSRNTPTVALGFDRRDNEIFSVALAGSHPTAAWIALDNETRGSQADLDWVTAHGASPYRGYGQPYIAIRKLQNTPYETLTVHTAGGATVTFVRAAGQEILRLDGFVAGGVSLKGHTFVVKSDGRRGVMTSHAL